MRMRTIEQAYQHLMEHDPGNALSRYALRRMVVEGRIPSVIVGTRYLIDLDRLEEHLYSPQAAPSQGEVRPVPLRL